jgi:uncharacterized membrane protein YbhN (UPF0104 family)
MSTNNRFNLIWNALKILVAVVLVWYVFSQTDLNEFLSLRERIVIPYLVATILLYAVLTLLKAFKYQMLLQQNTEYLRVLNVVVLQNAISNFFANSVGIASYMAMLKVEENVKVGKSGLVFLIIKIGDLFAVWLVMLVFGVLYWDQISVVREAFVLAEVVIGIGLAFFFGVLFFRSFFVNSFSKWMERLGLTRFSLIRQVIQAIQAFAEMDHKAMMRIVLIAFGLSLFYYFFTLGWQVVSMYTFGFHVQVWVIIFVSGILQLFSMLPINIFGGIGITEATAFYLYPLFGANQDELSLILLGWRILYYLTNLIVLIYLPIYTVFIERRMRPKE